MLIGVIVLFLLVIQYANDPELYWRFNLVEVGLTSIPLILYALIFLIQNLQKSTHTYFYFCNGLIVYLTSSACIFLTGNSDSVLFTEPFVLDFWFFNSLFYILYQFLIYKEWKFLNSHFESTETDYADKVTVVE
ncbi:hypothetical protein [Flavobacterium agrisoli]|uniref:Uncharacterized protein n=1 Tax=Flavobacterium agrisoli TaxID=2793066 RepID=A0A934PNZ5_9FLAO|nr:hypothetical protein [Flavobacterium agrisoli]MBK0370370.1 hypothetical protein [Flavobacterium agrisoli]